MFRKDKIKNKNPNVLLSYRILDVQLQPRDLIPRKRLTPLACNNQAFFQQDRVKWSLNTVRENKPGKKNM